jgi:hypothetical protein
LEEYFEWYNDNLGISGKAVFFYFEFKKLDKLN